MLWFHNIKTSRKISIIVLFALIGVALIAGLALEELQAQFLEGHKIAVKQVADAAYALVSRYQQDAQSGKMTEGDAQQAALSDLRAMRYGDGDYLWVNDMAPVMLMHPVKPELNGKPIGDIKTPSGAYLFRDMVAVVQRSGGDFYSYVWPKPGFSEPVRKISYVRGFTPWGWVIGTGVYIDDVDAEFHGAALRFGGLALLIAALVIGLSLMIARELVRPLRELTDNMGKMADGDLAVPIVYVERLEEVGAMSRALSVFRDAMAHARDVMQAQVHDHAQRERLAKAQAETVEKFNRELAEIVESLVLAAVKLEVNAHVLNEVAEDTGHQAAAVAAASEQASANVQTVAAASEELAASSREIANQVARASNVAQSAATEAGNTDQLVAGLADAASQIGDVVKLINDIASQTNLLALNATIEAARAGDAGKGFAVVANEVKHLASQTARATDEISSQIQAVQDKTRMAVSAIRDIAATIHQMDEISSAIAAAVEQQGAATQEITRNIQEAHSGTAEVSRNVVAVSDGARRNLAGSNDVLGAARNLNQQAFDIRSLADDFFLNLQSDDAALVWGPTWITGQKVIDADHKMLVQYVNELQQAKESGSAHQVAMDVLEKLVNYTRDHFAREEVIWSEGGLPSLDSHKGVHADLVSKVMQFQRDFQSGKATLTDDLITFLRGWLIDHVFKTDKVAVMEINRIAVAQKAKAG